MLKLLCLIFNGGLLVWMAAWVIAMHQWPIPFVTFIVMVGSICNLIYLSQTVGFAKESLLGVWLERLTLEEKNKVKKLKEKLYAWQK